MSKYRIKHITRYTYPASVIDSANQVMLFPLDDSQQEVKKHDLIITHQPSVEVFTDYFGNKVGIFSVIRPHRELTIESIIEVITYETKLPDRSVAAEDIWQNLKLIDEQFPYMDFLQQESFEFENEIHEIVNKLMASGETPFDIA